MSKKISPETAVYTLKEVYSILFIIQEQQLHPHEKKKNLIGGGQKEYTFLSFYVPVKTTQLKEMVSLPAVCNQSTSSCIRGYTLCRKCFPVKVKLWQCLLCYIMDHAGGCMNVGLFLLLLCMCKYPSQNVIWDFSFRSALKTIDSSATVPPSYFSYLKCSDFDSS